MTPLEMRELVLEHIQSWLPSDRKDAHYDRVYELANTDDDFLFIQLDPDRDGFVVGCTHEGYNGESLAIAEVYLAWEDIVRSSG